MTFYIRVKLKKLEAHFQCENNFLQKTSASLFLCIIILFDNRLN